MQQGVRIGLRPRVLTGVNPLWVPQTADEWAAALPSVTAPDSLWVFDEATGDFADRIGSHDFSLAAGSITRRVPSAAGYGVSLDATTTSLTIASTTFMDGGTATDLSALVVGVIATAPATTSAILSKRAGTGDEGWQVYTFVGATQNRVAGLLDGGAAIDNPVVAADHRSVVAVLTLDWSSVELETNLGSASDATLAVTNIANTAALTVGANASTQAPTDFVVDFVAVKSGYAWTADERAALVEFFQS